MLGAFWVPFSSFFGQKSLKKNLRKTLVFVKIIIFAKITGRMEQDFMDLRGVGKCPGFRFSTISCGVFSPRFCRLKSFPQSRIHMTPYDSTSMQQNLVFPNIKERRPLGTDGNYARVSFIVSSPDQHTLSFHCGRPKNYERPPKGRS